MQKSCVGFQNAAEGAGLDHPAHALHGRKKRKLRRAPDEGGFFHRSQDRRVRREIDPERLLAHQMLALPDRRPVNLFVQIVRHRRIHGINLLVGKQLAVVGGVLFHRQEMGLKPIEAGRVLVADPHDFRTRRRVVQVAPARGRTGKFAGHEAGTNNSKSDGFHMCVCRLIFRDVPHGRGCPRRRGRRRYPSRRRASANCGRRCRLALRQMWPPCVPAGALRPP